MYNYNLQLFGGRGAGAGMKRGGGVIDKAAKVRTIETEYREARGWQSAYYKSEVLEAVDAGNGQVAFEYATPESREKPARRKALSGMALGKHG